MSGTPTVLISSASIVDAYTVKAIQFLAGLLCLRALVFSKNALKSKLIKVMIVHTIALELANIVGFITAVIGLQWYLGPIQNLGYEPYEPASIGRRTPDLFIAAGSESRKEWLSEVIFWVSKVNVLNVISNVAFAVSGLLTDAMLVSSFMRTETVHNLTRNITDMAMPTDLEMYALPSTKHYRFAPCFVAHSFHR